MGRRGQTAAPEEEARRITRKDDVVADGLFVTVEELMQPPAVALEVRIETGPDTQVFGPLSVGLALPPLTVEISAACLGYAQLGTGAQS